MVYIRKQTCSVADGLGFTQPLTMLPWVHLCYVIMPLAHEAHSVATPPRSQRQCFKLFEPRMESTFRAPLVPKRHLRCGNHGPSIMLVRTEHHLGFDREHARHGYPRSQVGPIPSPHSLACRLSANTCVRQYLHKAKLPPHAASCCLKAFPDKF